MGRFLFRDYSGDETSIKDYGRCKKESNAGRFWRLYWWERTIKGLKEETCIDRCIYKGKKLLKRKRKG